MCTYIQTWQLTISITQEACEALLREKMDNESFTDTILRITKKSDILMDSFGAWKMTDQEEEKIKTAFAEGWHLTEKIDDTCLFGYLRSV